MKLSGIYTIRNLITGAVYVGQTINLKDRREHHFGLLSKGKHPNRRLQEDYSTYGSGAFVFRREEFCLTGFLCEREAHYIKQLGASYNQTSPPKRIRRDSPRFDPFLQDLRL